MFFDFASYALIFEIKHFEMFDSLQVAQVDTWTKSLQIAVYYLSQCTRAYWLLAARYFEVDPAGREFKHRKISPSFDIDIDKVHDLEYQVMTEDQYKQQLKTSVHHQLLPVVRRTLTCLIVNSERKTNLEGK